MDNNTAERAIRPFNLGRKNWVNVDSIRGAEASAIMYSLVEIAKSKGLLVYRYLKYVLTEIAAHHGDTNRGGPRQSPPMVQSSPEKCNSLKKVSKKF